MDSTRNDKPEAPPYPTHEQVPPELLSLKRWIGWRYELNKDRTKWVKLPLSTFTGATIGATPSGKEGQNWKNHWADFDTALAGAKRLKLDGVGFVFVEGEGFTGVDFDDCRFSESGIIRDVPRRWLDNFDTYVEVSPSGTGVHAIGKATLQAPGNKQPMPDDVIVKVEMYDKARYFTFTGQRLDGKPLEIRHVQPEFNALHHHVFGDASLEPSELEFSGISREFFTDERIISRLNAFRKWADIFNPEKKAKEFVAQHYKGDDSAADLAFCTVVSRYSMSPAQVERLWITLHPVA
jgi:primase-polymerase (primpol)-like protein